MSHITASKSCHMWVISQTVSHDTRGMSHATQRSEVWIPLCVAVCCSMLQCVAVCCSMLQRVAACCRKVKRSGFSLHWRLGICDITRWNESCHTWKWDMSHMEMSHVTCNDELIPFTLRAVNESWHIWEWVKCKWEWVMSHARMRHSSYTRMSHIEISHVTHGNESCHT